MKLALCVNYIRKDISQNIGSMKRYITEAALNNADCIVFSEATLTGLINNDDPEHNLALSYSVESIVIQGIFDFCAENKIDIVFGFFEKSDCSIYDSAVYYDHEKDITHTYRRISSGWHGAGKSSEIYRQGTDIEVVYSKIGKISILICGDLFDVKLVEVVRTNDSELVIVPHARCFSAGIDPVTEWNSVEKNAYAEQVKKIGKETVLVNYISGFVQEDYFGGALYVGKEGNVKAEKRIFEEGILYVDIH